MNALPSSGRTDVQAASETLADTASDTAADAASDTAIDFAAGLQRVMGDQDMYLRILARFRLDYRDKVARLRMALDAGDMPLAQRIAHMLKGAAAMIDARRLRALAIEAEQELHAKDCVPLPLVEDLEGELARVMAQLDTLLPAPAKPAPDGGSEAILKADVAQLCALLDIGDSMALDFIEENRAGLRTQLGAPRMAKLESAAAEFDFERALRVLHPEPKR